MNILNDTEFDQTPVDEMIQHIETMINDLQLDNLSADSIAEIHNLIISVKNQLGNIQGDEDDVDAGSTNRLEELRQKLVDISSTNI